MEYAETESQLPGYERQLFTSTLVDLARTYANAMLNRNVLQRIGQRISGYLKIDRPTTEDGYSWFLALHFSQHRFFLLPKWEVAILFPWATSTASGEHYLDRPVVACVRGHVGIADVDGLVQKVTEALAERTGRISNAY